MSAKSVVSRGELVKTRPEPSSSSTDWKENSLESANKKGFDELSEQSSELEEKLKQVRQNMYAKHRNYQKKVKRRDRELELKKKQVKEGKRQIRGLQKTLSEHESSDEQMKKRVWTVCVIEQHTGNQSVET